MKGWEGTTIDERMGKIRIGKISRKDKGREI